MAWTTPLELIGLFFFFSVAAMNALLVFSVLVASCYAGYDKKILGGGVYPGYPGIGKKIYISMNV